MKAIVLVGGEGTRLRPLTLTTPKQMLPVVELRMIERVMGHLGAHGVDGAVLSLGYKPDAFKDAFADGIVGGVEVAYAVEREPLDTAGAIGFAARQAGIDETFIAVNGDVLTDVDVSALSRFHKERDALATISLAPVEDPSAFGVVATDAEGKVEAFIEKPPRDQAPTNLINAGTYVLEPQVLDSIPAGRPASIERETFPALVPGGRVFALGSDAYWIDTGTPAKYMQAHRDLLEGMRPGPPAPGAHAIGVGVWSIGHPDVRGEVAGHTLLGDKAEVHPDARVFSSVVGAGSIVSAGAWVVGSVLFRGVAIGPGAAVEYSIVGEGAVVGEEAHVRSSLIGNGETLPDGTRALDVRVPDDEGRGSPGLGAQ